MAPLTAAVPSLEPLTVQIGRGFLRRQAVGARVTIAGDVDQRSQAAIRRHASTMVSVAPAKENRTVA